MTSWVDVLVFATITALATGLGAIPFLFLDRDSRRWLGVSNAIAAGLMLAASFGLFYEGIGLGLIRTGGGILAGLAFIVLTERWVADNPRMRVGELSGADALKALMIVGIMTIHSAAEGIGVGVSFVGGRELGLFITIAIAVHNVPEGLAISLVLVPRGTSVARAAGWSVFSSLPQPLLAVPAFLFVEAFEPLLPVGLGFAGGAMVWMVFHEIVPDALEETSKDVVATVLTISMVAMLVFQALLRGTP